MNAVRMGMPIFLIIISLITFFSSLNLPKAKLGDPNGPMYFPLVISICLFTFSVIHLVQECRAQQTRNEHIERLLVGKTLALIGMILVLSIVYTLIFELVGFLFATIFYLGALLFTLNGKTKWKVNITVAVVFSLIIWYVFKELLSISLP
ncbi:tripartite tricarboxylate transporter TctB family protein (plasmid) [Priestia filamentosa]|uniref:Tripartite tricarboxylate transporter TctB family protein n=1 Tax=Priestia filamentosa TaxID=1402861 RepID=A0A2S1LZW7_9BACI|nr:tripartite tricarboxylate transporter TctB family protein [Priestia filamentosa]AWG44359.1 tripartite tricarboxylate transporter TctB family protein [Priestia filamentosa]